MRFSLLVLVVLVVMVVAHLADQRAAIKLDGKFDWIKSLNNTPISAAQLSEMTEYSGKLCGPAGRLANRVLICTFDAIEFGVMARRCLMDLQKVPQAQCGTRESFLQFTGCIVWDFVAKYGFNPLSGPEMVARARELEADHAEILDAIAECMDELEFNNANLSYFKQFIHNVTMALLASRQ